MVAENYPESRRTMATMIGLGRKLGQNANEAAPARKQGCCGVGFGRVKTDRQEQLSLLPSRERQGWSQRAAVRMAAAR